jgi:hypothetical protein
MLMENTILITCFEPFGGENFNASMAVVEAMPKKIGRGDVIDGLTTGAYHYSMASNYNKLPRPPIVMLNDKESYIAVRRETPEHLAMLDM